MQLPVHQADQTLADHQTKTRTTETASGGGLGLGKALKDALQLLGTDTNAGVADLDAQLHGIAHALHLLKLDQHLALLGELEGIASQIDQYLLQSQAVAKQSTWQLRVQIEHDFDIFLPQVATQHHCQIAQQ